MSLFFNKTRILILALFLSIFQLSTLAAQDEEADSDDSFDQLITSQSRYQGDIGLQFNGYLWAPLFNIDPEGRLPDTNLEFGGGADIAVIYYLTANLGIGGFLDLGITAPKDQNNVNNYFLAVLLGARVSYDFNLYTKRYNRFPFLSFPLGFGLAVSAAKFGEVTNMIPVMKLDAGVYINPFEQPEWSFGLSLHYWFAPEFSKTELSRIGNYLMIGVGFNFHSGL